MCVYIQVNTEITICRPEQIAQARLGCSGDLDQTNKNTDHYVFFKEKEVRNWKTVNIGDLAANYRWRAAHAQLKSDKKNNYSCMNACLISLA